MKSCTTCEVDISDDMCICEHCAEVLSVEIAEPSEVISDAEPEPVEALSAPAPIAPDTEDESEQEPQEIAALSPTAPSAEDDSASEQEPEAITASPPIELELEILPVDLSDLSDLEADTEARQEPEAIVADIADREPKASAIEPDLAVMEAKIAEVSEAEEIISPSDVEPEAERKELVDSESKPEIEPEPLPISEPSEIESGFETIPADIVVPSAIESITARGDIAISSDIEVVFDLEPVGVVAVADIEAAIDTVQVDISASSDIEAGIDTFPMEIVVPPDIEASIDTVRVDSARFSESSINAEDLELESYIPYAANSGNIEYEHKELRKYPQPIEDLEEPTAQDEGEDIPSTTPFMYYDNSAEKGLQAGIFAVPTPLYSDSGIMLAQSEVDLPASILDDEDDYKYDSGESEEGGSSLFAPTLFYSGVQPAIQPTIKAPVPLQAKASRPGLSVMLVIFLMCLIIITSSGISILFVKAHSRDVVPVALVPKLKVKTQKLNYGQVTAGTQVILATVITNAGEQTMNWYVDTGNLAWLKVNTPRGTTPAGGAEQFIYTTVDASKLAIGNYTGEEDIHSNGGNARIPIQMQVIPSTGKKAAKLNVDQSAINLAVQPGQQVTTSITVGNVGNQSLSWQANIGNTGWLSLGTTPVSGTIPAGGFPQTFNIIADATNLAPATYAAVLDMRSNGGNAQINISLVVSTIPTTMPPTLAPTTRPTSAPPTLAPTKAPTSTPTLTPTTPPSPPTWSVTPSSLDSSCLATGCTVTLTENTASSGNIAWSASSDVGATFSPANGTLTPGSSQSVTISGMVCNNGTFTFSMTGGATPQTVAWICSPTTTPTPTTPPTIIAPTAPPPTNTPTVISTSALSASPTTLAGCLSCTVTLTAQGALSWSASSNLSGVTFNPPSGALPNGQSAQVGIMPNQSCPASGTFYFAGPANTLAVSWSCAGSTLTVGPTSFSPTGCSTSSTGGWQCGIMLTSDPNSQGTLNWTASTSGGSGIVLSQMSGSLAPAGSVQISATIPASNCPGTGQLVFTGPSNTATSTWSC